MSKKMDINSKAFELKENQQSINFFTYNSDIPFVDDPRKYVIDLRKIRCGEERRTTLMIKNIPSRYSQDCLLNIINIRYTGLYDYFYLPLDAKQFTNIGYAFINFINPNYIINFFKEFNQRRWELFKSPKICKLSFARLQGKKNLKNHFKDPNEVFSVRLLNYFYVFRTKPPKL